MFLAVWAVISIHALLAESDRLLMCFWLSGLLFLSTLSLRRATCSRCTTSHRRVYFYPRSPCGERPRQTSRLLQGSAISIHALLAESDIFRSISATVRPYFYPRSPYGERPMAQGCNYKPPPFLSTLSLRRATCVCEILRLLWKNFYPRSPCGERLVHLTLFNRTINISIHALLAESDSLIFPPVDTSSVISIHALLAESDNAAVALIAADRIFLSTLSLRRATDGCRPCWPP